MEQDYSTIIGENGLKLSGGQRQRIFIARELFRQPNILVMDEATSALDNNSENFIKRTLEKLKGKVTSIIVTHRLSTIKNVDKIFVIKEGRIVEEGNYTELSNKKDSYFNHLNQVY